MIETLQLAVNIEEEQLVSSRTENWDRDKRMQALEGLNETAQNIHTARQYGRVSKKMERVLFKRLGKVAKSYMNDLRKMEREQRDRIGPIKVTQTEMADGSVHTEIEPDVITEDSIADLKTEEKGKDEVNLKPSINVDHAKMKNMLTMDRVMVREPDGEE